MDDVNAHLEQEENGPRRALFQAWAEEALKELETTTKAIEAAQGTSGSKKTVLELLQKRLEYNVPVLNHLPTVSSASVQRPKQ